MLIFFAVFGPDGHSKTLKLGNFRGLWIRFAENAFPYFLDVLKEKLYQHPCHFQLWLP